MRPDLLKCYLLHACAGVDTTTLWFPWPHATIDLVEHYVCRVNVGEECEGGVVMVNIFDRVALEGIGLAFSDWAG